MIAAASTLARGTEIPVFERTVGFHAWNRFAAVRDEFVDIHMSDEAGRHAGYETAIGMGNLLWAYLHNMLADWIGEDGQILRLECQFRRPALRDRRVRACGRIAEVRTREATVEVDLEIWVEDGDGAQLAPGSATVAVPLPPTERKS